MPQIPLKPGNSQGPGALPVTLTGVNFTQPCKPKWLTAKKRYPTFLVAQNFIEVQKIYDLGWPLLQALIASSSRRNGINPLPKELQHAIDQGRLYFGRR